MKIAEFNVKIPLSRKGIYHIDDQSLPIDYFIHVMRNLHTYSVTEKVDGANLWFGLNTDGDFYTSRGNKGGGEYFQNHEWGNDYKDVGFKSAHVALEKHINIFKECGLRAGDCIEIEVLYGDKPNAIPYNKNQIIFLRNISGNVNLDSLSEVFGDTEVHLNEVPYTTDGRTIEYKQESSNWVASKVLEYSPEWESILDDVRQPLEFLEKLLNENNSGNLVNNDGVILINSEVLSARTNVRNKEIKTNLYNLIDGPVILDGPNVIGGYRTYIKQCLLKNLVHCNCSTLGPTIDEGGWIEGVVLRRNHGQYDELIKLVDKDLFTNVNKFNHEIRNKITLKHKGINSDINDAGLLGNLIRDMMSYINHPILGTIQAKRYLKNNNFDDIILSAFDGRDINDVKQRWSNMIEIYINKLEHFLNNYIETYNRLCFIDSIGRQHKYDKAIHIRTLQVFSSTFNMLEKWYNDILSVEDEKELLMIVIGDKL